MNPEVDVLTVLHAPGYAPAMDEVIIARIEELAPDSAGISEAYRIAGRPLHNRRDYRARVGRSDRDTRAVVSPMGDAGDTPILVRGDLDIVRHRAFKVTNPNAALWRKFAPERWLNVVSYEWAGRTVTHINVHPSPYFAGPRKWLKVMRAAVREVHAAKARGELVVLTGDLQTGRATALLREAGLTVWAVGVDFIATFGFRRAGVQVVNVPRLDHPWMLARLRVA